MSPAQSPVRADQLAPPEENPGGPDERPRGQRNLAGQPVAISDHWNLSSDGKAMTATMIARLVERKLLRWDTPLAQMLPDLAADMHSEYRDVTLLELLSHRAGLPENLSDLAFFKTFYGNAQPLPAQRLDYLRRAVAEAPIGPARGNASYSNICLILVGAIAERATGRSYEQLMQQEVFRPLGIQSARFTQSPETGEFFRPCRWSDRYRLRRQLGNDCPRWRRADEPGRLGKVRD